MYSGRLALPRALYRVRQFSKFCRASVSKAEQRVAAEQLGESLFPLFMKMALPDQRHCLDVYHSLRDSDCDDPEMLTAALIHDVGKSNVGIWQRVAYVLLRQLAPRQLRSIASNGTGWRVGLSSLHYHEKAGGQLAKAAGASDAIVQLISGDSADIRKTTLRAVDDSC